MGEMHVKSDVELLRDYAEHGGESTFREIVHRHADLIYASAARQVNSRDVAHDVAQEAFTDLARKAQTLAKIMAPGASLLGWLYRRTRFAALNHLRDDRRRQSRERQAMQDFDSSTESTIEWDRVRPVLDEAMADLDDADREAVLLRYFKNHDFRAIGAAIGASDDTAQKRVSRALERLRAEFNRRGISTTAVALSTVLSVNAAPVAPIGLATALSSAALAGTTLATVTQALAMTTLHKAIIGATIAVAVGTGLYQAVEASKLRGQIQLLQQQEGPIVGQLQQLKRDRDDAAGKLALLRDENERLSRNTTELLRLRGEMALLRKENMVLAKRGATADGNADLQARPQPVVGSLANVGAGTPENGFQTFLWASKNGDSNLVSQMLRWRKDDNVSEEMANLITSAQTPSFLKTFSGLAGIRIVAQKVESPDSSRMRVEFREDNGKTNLGEIYMLRDHGEWKPAINISTRPGVSSIGASYLLPMTPDLGPVNGN